MPYLVYPDGSIRNNSTLLVYDLERKHPNDRSLLTGDRCLDFLSHLIEDFADEWGTRIMAHYRWNFAADQQFCSHWIADDLGVGKSISKREGAAETFRKRQMDRRPLLGVSPMNAPLLEKSYRAVLECLRRMLAEDEFLFGTRPALADFGLFGQLFQMSIDPTPSALMRLEAPEVFAWVLRMDDGSGVEGAWQPEASLNPAVGQFLKLIGKYYLPLLRANLAAAKAGKAECHFTIDGLPFAQQTSKYHVKCANWLREEYEALDPSSRKRVDDHLEVSQCSSFFSGEQP